MLRLDIIQGFKRQFPNGMFLIVSEFSFNTDSFHMQLLPLLRISFQTQWFRNVKEFQRTIFSLIQAVSKRNVSYCLTVFPHRWIEFDKRGGGREGGCEDWSVFKSNRKIFDFLNLWFRLVPNKCKLDHISLKKTIIINYKPFLDSKILDSFRTEFVDKPVFFLGGE